MSWKAEWKSLIAIVVVFLAVFFLPLDSQKFNSAIFEGLHLAKWYAREHVVFCLVPAFFIAGAIGVFVSRESVIRYLGAGANKVLAYGVASVSGSILAVCSCTVLPLFAGIYRMGAGLGPATAFLYAGPAINVLAIVLTVRVLGLEIGIARAVGAILFSVVIGLFMHIIFRKSENENKEKRGLNPLTSPRPTRPLWQNAIYFASMVGILVFANWGAPDQSIGIWNTIYEYKWLITGIMSVILAVLLVIWLGISWLKVTSVALITVILAILFGKMPMIPFAAATIGLSVITSGKKGEAAEWFDQSWTFARQILPLLLFGVLIAGILLGRPGKEGLVSSAWISDSVGGNSFGANFFASVAGAFMYFATLTEVPILQGLLGSGMGKGPALALLLAGPALSLPSMLVLRSIMGTKKTIVFIALVIIMATLCGMIFGALF